MQLKWAGVLVVTRLLALVISSFSVFCFVSSGSLLLVMFFSPYSFACRFLTGVALRIYGATHVCVVVKSSREHEALSF